MPTPLANALAQYAPPQQTPSTPLAQALMDYASRVQGDFAHGLDESAQGFGEMLNGQLATGIPRTFLGGLGWMGSPVSGAVSPLLNPVLQPVAQGVHDYVGKPVENATGYPADLTTELALALALPKALHGAGKAVNSAVPYLASLGDAVGSRMGGAPEGSYMSGPGPKSPISSPVGGDEGIIAYHGSPHTFDKFSMDKIGTGEGAQAYGHGLYFAENEKVAKSYKNALSGTVEVKPGVNLTAEERKLAGLASAFGKGDLPAIKDALSKSVQSGIDPKIAKSVAEKFDSGDIRVPGSMYQVRLNVKPHELLDWDKPLSEQPESVRTLMGWDKNSYDSYRKAMSLENDSLVSALNGSGDFVSQKYTKPNGAAPIGMTGGQVYESSRLVPGEFRDKVAATEKLKAAGIKGIRYKDAGSRGGDGSGGTHNYVIFDDKLIDILKRYGVPMTAGAGGAMMVAGQNMPPEVANQLGPQS